MGEEDGEEGDGDDMKSTGPLKLSLTYEKEIRLGPVTALAGICCDGKRNLIIGAGSEVTIEQWKDRKLQQIGFHHANAHIIAIKVFKAYFLLVDAYDSVSFLVWRENDKSLTLLSRDYSGRNTFAAGVISRARNLAFVVHDDRENIQVFQYAPNDDESEGGNKLVCRADMHIGTTA